MAKPMDAVQTTQQVSMQHTVDVLTKFLFEVQEARSGKQRAESAPHLFRAGERDSALRALQVARGTLTEVSDLLIAIAPQLDHLQQELEAIEGGPENTPTGLSYDSPIPTTGLSTRAYNCLKGGEVKTMRQLCALDGADLMRMRSLGRKTLDEIIAYRSQIGVPLILAR